ncbi:MAG: SUMF1/EgtB/PvdO family nonheme iron enzyme [Flavobacteriales bacterium]
MSFRTITYSICALLLVTCSVKPEHPIESVHFPEMGIWVDSCEVTGIEFQRFVLSSEHKLALDSLTGYVFNRNHLQWEEKSGLDYLIRLSNNQIDSLAPAVNVSWEDACAYCNARKGRLPTAEEWEGLVDYKEIPGNIWEGYFPTKDEGKDGYLMTYAPVNAFSANVNGLYNLRGNVWEWTSTEVAGSYLIKGGSYLTDYAQGGFLPDVKVAVPSNSLRCDLGFRCVYDK